MPQSSAPIAVGTDAERQLTDLDWRDAFGDEAGVLGDLDGTAYRLTLPTNSDNVTVGSATQRSMARVAGFVHRIPAGETESLTIPAASGSARTDIVVLRYDPSFTGAPGPVRLTRVAGTSSGIPSYDDAPPGIEDLPLWAITRQPGQALSQATTRDLRVRLGPALELPVGAPLPLSSPLGSTLRQGTVTYRRELDAAGLPAWRRHYGGGIIDVFTAPWTNPEGFFGGTNVGGVNRQELTWFRVPDPGVPYRPQITLSIFFGTDDPGTRWDVGAGYGGVGNENVTTALAYALTPGEHGKRLHRMVTGPVGPVLTGQRDYRVIANRIFGGGLGWVSAANRLLSVTYWAA